MGWAKLAFVPFFSGFPVLLFPFWNSLELFGCFYFFFISLDIAAFQCPLTDEAIRDADPQNARVISFDTFEMVRTREIKSYEMVRTCEKSYKEKLRSVSSCKLRKEVQTCFNVSNLR